MNYDRINRWLTLGANIAVLLGIIFLGIEIRQNSELARLQFADTRMNTWQQGELVVWGNSISTVWEKSVYDAKSLTLAETRMLDAYLAFQLSNAIRVLELEKAGLVEEGSTQRHLESEIPFFFDTDFAKTWWEIEGQGWDPELSLLADPIINLVARNESVTKLENIREQAALKMDAQN